MYLKDCKLEIIDGSKDDIEDSDIVRIVNPGYVDEWLESE